MKIKQTYSQRETQEKLGSYFGLKLDGQDWDLINSSASMVDDFIKYFHKTKDQKEIISLCLLILASINDIKSEEIRNAKLNSIFNKITDNFQILACHLIYWAAIGSGEDLENTWSISFKLREYLNERMEISKFTIECNEIYGIKLGDEYLIKLLSSKKMDLNFEELLKRLNKSQTIMLSDSDIFEIEISNDFTFLNLRNPNSNNFYKFQTNDYIHAIKNHEI